jgi:Fuc2NAc and GlcNAc transferase
VKMEAEAWLIAVCSLVASALLTGLVRKLALSHGVIDVPNERSSHTTPTPRGGGIAIASATLGAVIALAALGKIELRLLAAFVGGGAMVATVGFIDDRRPLSAGIRLAVHFAAALWALVWLEGLPPLRIAGQVFEFGIAGYLLGALGIVWTLNLFNFMDGIDGIAASEAAFIAVAGSLLAIFTGAAMGVTAIALATGAACAGFLLWNWPPAKIFMGDVGSAFLGFTIAVLAIASARQNTVGLLVWLLLGGVFFVDATVTFVRRLLRREPVHEAHRSHAYQWLARRWNSHRRVTIVVVVVNLIWLLPCAWFATVRPASAAWITLGGLAPLVLIAVGAGSGRAERPGRAGRHCDAGGKTSR